MLRPAWDPFPLRSIRCKLKYFRFGPYLRRRCHLPNRPHNLVIPFHHLPVFFQNRFLIPAVRRRLHPGRHPGKVVGPSIFEELFSERAKIT